MVSLTRLEEVAGKAETLRCVLRSAFLEDAPRIEVTIFEQLQKILEHWLLSSSTTNAAAAAAPQSDDDAHLLIEQYYLQEVFAAMLFLADESFPQQNRTVRVETLPRLDTFNILKSEFYVDVQVRRYCTELLLYFCFSRVCQTYRVVQALYPLLLHGKRALVSGASQNHVGEGLFNAPRFLQKKKFISSLLNGLMMTLPDGVMGVVRVLLLDDRVEEGMAMDAAKQIASLFYTPLHRAWVLKEGSVTYTECLTLTEQVMLLSAQLVNLLACVTEKSVTPEVDLVQHRLPLFLKRQSNRQGRLLKRETIEERLQLGIATMLNATLHLPPRDEKDNSVFARSYKCFCLYNRHLLTPAFRALTLRVATGDRDRDEVLLALRRLLALARGCTLGPSPRALLLTLEPLSPGLLELLALGDALPAEHCALLEGILAVLWELPAQFEELAHILVRGALMSVRGSYSVDRVQMKVFVDLQCPSPTSVRIRGLRRFILHAAIPKDAVCKVLMATATMCQQRAAMPNASAVEERKKSSNSAAFLYTEDELEGNADSDSEEIMLGRIVEEMCLQLSAEELFGTRVTLDRVCEVVSKVATISYACWRWAVLLIPRILAVDVIHSIFTEYASAMERHKAASALLSQLQQLSSLVDALQDDVVDTAAATTLEICIATVQQYDSDAYTDDTTFAEWRTTLRMIEESLDVSSTASLVVHLLALSRGAAEAASRLSRKQMPSGRKTVNDNCPGDVKECGGVVQSAMWLLVRVLVEVDDACAAVAACTTLTWWSLARLDSVDSSFVSRLVLGLLSVDEGSSVALRSILSGVTCAVTPPRISRMKVRLLDVLLGLCDYDEEGRTLRNIDDYCKLERRCTLYDVLVGLCGSQHSPVVQVAALHLIGHYTIATYPRVSLAATCTLCVDVFRHTTHEMAKAACASMLSHVAGALETMGVLAALNDVDLEVLHRMTEAMCSYRGAVGDSDDHESVIHYHGRCIRRVLQHSFHVLREA
ncbi:hypothetical protein TraAM80_02157 [Trypanosoma rangeli]|uniref:Uncharacterized protein n=1 Tax=Trypanosoma rangeli TaxID=5698 RepID=A0A422NVF5_TRYRA|nr:uncharacterized protein TraAM80_02157 [Trypanosoma rangeli]RNF09446.1 hypothetical protein TraAM80_02157 [Trypanosoma rangeli]|eukprot:RNF09446.1 hypothetical protein TraAM80_02157 [Trypanosoma rangeli]